MRVLFFTTLWLMAANGQAQQVYKCEAGSVVSYQSQPCAHGQRTARQWDVVPDPVPAPVPASGKQSRRDASPPHPPVRLRAKGRGNRSSTSPADRRCDAAKARREAKLQAVGLKRTYDLLRDLDAAVRAACGR